MFTCLDALVFRSSHISMLIFRCSFFCFDAPSMFSCLDAVAFRFRERGVRRSVPEGKMIDLLVQSDRREKDCTAVLHQRIFDSRRTGTRTIHSRRKKYYIPGTYLYFLCFDILIFRFFDVSMFQCFGVLIFGPRNAAHGSLWGRGSFAHIAVLVDGTLLSTGCGVSLG